ncbi:hypothetical protein Cgig2_008975 [Carnegiea gigantea]|uniref:Uncharacterized protein n=1 Tax=Carnegiea gigantea TaxID=171969 RepID=A0A9Q1K802_9CARY|nr:hypothetical protein Cgig2_008975 [Carnegiea gigantea]
MNGEKTPTTEEVDQLLQSMKKMKRTGNGRSQGDTTAAEGETMDMDLGSPRVPETSEERNDNILHEQTRSYRDMLQQNNPNLNMDMRTNPIWREATYKDLTYGSWMLVQKPPRRRAHRNHGPAGNRDTTGHGPIQEEQRMEPNRVSTRTDGDSNLESSVMTTNLQRQQDHGSKFRALTEIDLNCVAEATLNENLSLQEREVNNKEDSLPTLEETAGMADMAEDQDHHDPENHGDKENIPTAIPEMDHIPVEPSRLAAYLGQLDTVHSGPRNAPRNLSPPVYSPPTNPPTQHNDADTEASRGSVNRPGPRARTTPPNMTGSRAFTRPTPSQPPGGHWRPTREMAPNRVTNRGMGLDRTNSDNAPQMDFATDSPGRTADQPNRLTPKAFI